MNGVTVECEGANYSQGHDGVLITDRWVEVEFRSETHHRAPLERRFFPWGRVAVVKMTYEEVE